MIKSTHQELAETKQKLAEAEARANALELLVREALAFSMVVNEDLNRNGEMECFHCKAVEELNTNLFIKHKPDCWSVRAAQIINPPNK